MTAAVDWQGVVKATPRGPYLPRVVWYEDVRGRMISVDRAREPERWQALAAADVALTTQLDDGGSGDEIPTSSASRPSIVARMLDALDARPGHRVLELGTGTGWNAALLCVAVGADQVTTMEIDPDVAKAAARALNSQGLYPRTLTGDGLAAVDPAAPPFDRIIATMAVRRVPTAWIARSRPGAVIVTPWGNAYNNSGLLRLVVADDGSASGRFVGNAAFMFARSHRRRFDGRRFLGDVIPDPDAGRETRTALDPREIHEEHADFAIGLRVPDVEQRTFFGSGAQAEEFTTWYADGTSWASVDFAPGATDFTVTQGGPRSVWDEIAAAYTAWVRDGRPRREEHGMTVTAGGDQTVRPTTTR
ncbi:methyltransferase domain-containing protein [Yinghuangia sp. ASG 101]|uniref:methyltransferase domain-containing protein n=1 Tax=Yinghuangia sp. ASG 101 TaxID=2896848 RepID=UPI001E5D9978|nr:methyltransferase domain-containing protein [Yinghuangia sp. ASG 101]UGQ14012.1 methyltransferase domain-containing protein [Yinghuangia sp. ASG 101]